MILGMSFVYIFLPKFSHRNDLATSGNVQKVKSRRSRKKRSPNTVDGIANAIQNQLGGFQVHPFYPMIDPP